MTSPYILIADDDPSILQLVAEILRDEGYAVELARNGREALDAIALREEPALIVLDMRMPIIDGWEFARRIRAQQIDSPILVMTAARDAREWAEEIGAVGYLAKPFDLDDFLREVGRFIPPPGTSRSDGRSILAFAPPAALITTLRRAIASRGASLRPV